MNFPFILIGSTHGFIDDFSKQKEIIELIKPEFVLCEELENLELDSERKFNELLKKRNISYMTSFDEVEKLIKLCFSKKIKLIGIDFHNFGFDDNLQRKIKNHEELTKEEEEKLGELIKSRGKHHLTKILQYQKKTSRPIIVILGCWHLREKSLLRKKLKNYKIIIPCGKNGNILLAPNKEGKIKYLEIISNGAQNKN